MTKNQIRPILPNKESKRQLQEKQTDFSSMELVTFCGSAGEESIWKYFVLYFYVFINFFFQRALLLKHKNSTAVAHTDFTSLSFDLSIFPIRIDQTWNHGQQLKSNNYMAVRDLIACNLHL